MMRVSFAGDVAPIGATMCGAAALVSSIGDVAMQVLGVPLPVVLAAGAGAWIARARSAAGASFARDFMATLGWWFAGCILPSFAAWGLEAAVGLKVPTNAQAGLALALAWALPLLVPIAEEKLPQLLRAWFDRKSGGGNG